MPPTKLAGRGPASGLQRQHGSGYRGAAIYSTSLVRVKTANSAYAAVIAAFAKAVIAGKPPVIYGDGEQTRDFTYVDNVVHSPNLLAASKEAPVAGEVINVGCGDQISVNSLAAQVARILGRPDLKPEHKAERAGGFEALLRRPVARPVKS